MCYPDVSLLPGRIRSTFADGGDPRKRDRSGRFVRRASVGRTFLLTVALTLLSPCVALAELRVKEALPELASHGLTGTVPATQGKVVLLDFWASWCAPCKASFPAYSRFHSEFAAQGLVVIAVSVDQDAGAFSAFVQKLRPPFATLHDVRQSLVKAVKVPAMPTAYLFGRDGTLRIIHKGFHGKETEEDLKRQILDLLKEPAPHL